MAKQLKQEGKDHTTPKRIADIFAKYITENPRGEEGPLDGEDHIIVLKICSDGANFMPGFITAAKNQKPGKHPDFVYGVPLKIWNDWDEKTRTEWVSDLEKAETLHNGLKPYFSDRLEEEKSRKVVSIG